MCFRNRIKLTQAEQSLGVDVLGGLQKTVAVRFLFCFLTKLKLLTIFYYSFYALCFPCSLFKRSMIARLFLPSLHKQIIEISRYMFIFWHLLTTVPVPGQNSLKISSFSDPNSSNWHSLNLTNYLFLINEQTIASSCGTTYMWHAQAMSYST